MTKRLLLFIPALVLISCNREINSSTSWDYNNPKNGGFQKAPFLDQETVPGMILVEGGEYHIPDFGYNDTLEINSFYISKYEETNGQYLKYLEFVRKYYSEATYQSALPDTNVWSLLDTTQKVKDHFIKNYFRHWTYRDYPVVGVSPEQIRRYASWKTDRINEMILIREGIFEENWEARDSTLVFSTRTYFEGVYLNDLSILDLNPNNFNRSRERRLRMEDGILLPTLRLPTEEEWQHAHLAIGDSNYRYHKTQKASKVKLKNFHFLNDVGSSSKKTYPPEMKLEGLQTVYSLEPNAYYLQGLNCNVSECVGDSLSVGIIGGSFFIPRWDNNAVYDKSIVSEVKYHIELPIQEAVSIDENEFKIYGFRLAMDRIGGLPYEYGRSRKRRYRYQPKY